MKVEGKSTQTRSMTVWAQLIAVSSACMRKFFWRILIFSWQLMMPASLAFGSEVPCFAGDVSASILHIAYSRGQAESLIRTEMLRTPSVSEGAVGRSAYLLSSEHLAQVVKDIPTVFGNVLNAESENMFILWRAGELTAQLKDDAVVAAFDVEAQTERTSFLSLGCDFAFVAVLNGAAICARAGYDYHLEGSSIIPLNLRPGRNEVRIIAVSDKKSRAGKYYDPPWELSIRLFADKPSAMAFHDTNNLHCLDTPLVSSLHEIRCINGSPVYRQAKLRNEHGQVVNVGEISSDGKVVWQRFLDSFHAGFLTIDDARGEPVLVCDKRDLDRLQPGTAEELNVQSGAASPWAYRLKHLLKPEFASHRESESRWARKLAGAHFKMYASSEYQNRIYSSLNSVRSFDLDSYDSNIDGTKQHFAYFLPKQRADSNKKTPVLLVLPTVQLSIRPFLESTVLAGSDQLEQWCGVADRNGFALLWPGYVDVDYGGAITQTQLKEVVAGFYQNHPNLGSLYVLGFCSSGVTALRYVSLNPDVASALLLQSPFLVRRVRRFTPGLWGDPIPIPYAPMEVRQLVGDFKVSNCAVMSDLAMVGHGEAEDLPSLFDVCRERNVPISKIESPVSQEYLWGSRMNYRIDLFFKWVASRTDLGKGSAPNLHPENSRSQKTTLICDSLLQGFTIVPGDQLLEDWRSWWNVQYLKWRGADLPSGRASSSLVSILLLEVTNAELKNRLLEVHLNVDVASKDDQLFAMLNSPRDNRVSVLRNIAARPPFPKIDPFLDGLFQACVWRRNADGRWQIVSIVR